MKIHNYTTFCPKCQKAWTINDIDGYIAQCNHCWYRYMEIHHRLFWFPFGFHDHDDLRNQNYRLIWDFKNNKCLWGSLQDLEGGTMIVLPWIDTCEITLEELQILSVFV
jgi:hypothetical protein